MEFAHIEYQKTVEGNFEVKLIHNNTVVANITFPTEELAKEYVDVKQKIKSHAEALIAEVTANLTKNASPAVKAEVASVEAAVEPVAEKAAAEGADEVVATLKAKVEKAKPIDTSAKVAKDTTIDTSAKAAKDQTIDTSAKIVV